MYAHIYDRCVCVCLCVLTPAIRNNEDTSIATNGVDLGGIRLGEKVSVNAVEHHFVRSKKSKETGEHNREKKQL